MWTKSVTFETKEVSKDQIWNILTDINSWNEWDNEVEWTKLEGPMQLNAVFFLKPKGGPKTKITISKLEKPTIFADVAHLFLAKMTTTHQITELENSLLFTMEIKIEGPLTFLWSKIIGQEQIDGGKGQIEKLIERAKTHG